MNQYNDYELLYLIGEFDEEAEYIFYEKYTRLIKNRINRFNIKNRFHEDFLQEGLFMLYIAIRTYDMNSNKTFNKYFDLILQRKFVKIIQKEKLYLYDVDLIEEPNVLYDESSFVYEISQPNLFSSLEEKVIDLKNKNYRPKEIAKILNCDVKSIYNCLCRIKNKTKS